MRSFNSSGICNLVFIKPRHGHYNSEDLRNSALNHLGLPRLPEFSAQAALASGKLMQVLKGWTLKGALKTDCSTMYSRRAGTHAAYSQTLAETPCAGTAPI